jgi:hypothetical protein
MEQAEKDTNKRRGRRAVALALLGATLALAACGGGSDDGGGASGSSTGAAAAGASGDGTTKASDDGVKYSQCMREHGIKDFPDPQNGRLLLQAGPDSDVNPDSPTFQAAAKACQSLQPAGAQSGGGTGGGDAALAMAKCMRENGVPKFPDPDVSGGKVTMKIDPSSGVDPDSASFKAAQAKCGSVGGAPQSGTTP